MAELPKIPPRLPGGNYPRADALEVHLKAAQAENERMQAELARLRGSREPPHCITCACGMDAPSQVHPSGEP